MPLRFDATMKDLARRYPEDYVLSFRLGNALDIHALNVDLSVISAATDVVLGHGDPLTSVLDLNFQSGPDPDLPDRLCLYNAAPSLSFPCARSTAWRSCCVPRRTTRTSRGD